ncbi:uncharacterized [Tachysurus ichikawai]
MVYLYTRPSNYAQPIIQKELSGCGCWSCLAVAAKSTPPPSILLSHYPKSCSRPNEDDGEEEASARPQ